MIRLFCRIGKISFFYDGGRYHKNQSIDLLSKSMDWFLYDNGPRHERVKWL